MTVGYSSQIFGEVLSRTPTALFGSTVTTAHTIAGFNSAALRSAANLGLTLSGALTADTYKTIISVSGGGVLHFAAVQAQDGTSRDMYIRVTFDSGTPLERSMLTCVTSGAYQVAVGTTKAISNESVANFVAMPFNSALLIEVKSSLTETDKLGVLFNYRTA